MLLISYLLQEYSPPNPFFGQEKRTWREDGLTSHPINPDGEEERNIRANGSPKGIICNRQEGFQSESIGKNLFIGTM
jgi:hypothetical protein